MLCDLGKVTPKAFAGDTCGVEDNSAVVMHVDLPDDRYAETDILNIFDQGQGDEIRFPETGFKTAEAFINGEKRNFADYLIRNNIDTHVPLVADYSGFMVNTSFQSVDAETGIVSFYAPVFRDVSYRHGQPVQDYEKEFILRVLRKKTEPMFFSCSCILNFLYYELKGRNSGVESSSIPFGDIAYREILSHLADRCNIFGPITSGEIANRLLNQTLAYLVIRDRHC